MQQKEISDLRSRLNRLSKKKSPGKDRTSVKDSTIGEIILHIGLGKTGTSTVQQLFSENAEYLRESRDKHLIFSELATLNSFLIQRNQVPVLPSQLQSKLGFNA